MDTYFHNGNAQGKSQETSSCKAAVVPGQNIRARLRPFLPPVTEANYRIFNTIAIHVITILEHTAII